MLLDTYYLFLLQDVQTFIDEAPHGVILFTLGSVISAESMPNERREAFLAAFTSIPQRVIWKFEGSIENLPKNIMISEWLPQRDILGTQRPREPGSCFERIVI